MMTDYEAALAAQRERVSECARDWRHATHFVPAHAARKAMNTALDDALRLARAIGAAEAMTDYGDRPGYAQQLRAEVDAIIRELEGA